MSFGWVRITAAVSNLVQCSGNIFVGYKAFPFVYSEFQMRIGRIVIRSFSLNFIILVRSIPHLYTGQSNLNCPVFGWEKVMLTEEEKMAGVQQRLETVSDAGQLVQQVEHSLLVEIKNVVDVVHDDDDGFIRWCGWTFRNKLRERKFGDRRVPRDRMLPEHVRKAKLCLGDVMELGEWLLSLQESTDEKQGNKADFINFRNGLKRAHDMAWVNRGLGRRSRSVSTSALLDQKEKNATTKNDGDPDPLPALNSLELTAEGVKLLFDNVRTYTSIANIPKDFDLKDASNLVMDYDEDLNGTLGLAGLIVLLGSRKGLLQAAMSEAKKWAQADGERQKMVKKTTKDVVVDTEIILKLARWKSRAKESNEKKKVTSIAEPQLSGWRPRAQASGRALHTAIITFNLHFPCETTVPQWPICLESISLMAVMVLVLNLKKKSGHPFSVFPSIET